ncbi:NLRC3 [Symbiodinium necroappetens]|uniref:NLRC3 protein n=1 Tax=Symbiodinium necroappetens TaxID=1628268 RepID=A0A812QMR0_9DINO|nr:NLRC3 [Symbiodinium necroappetens]
MGERRRQGVHLDLAAETPLPESEGNSPVKRGADPGQGSSKRVATQSGGDAPKQGQVLVDMGDLAKLLEETGNKIMQAQREHLEARMGALEDLTGKRMASAETRLGTVESKVDALESKLDELNKKLEQGDRRGGDSERRLTLIYGGWPRDSRRQDILKQLQRALEKLQVWNLLDSEPFTTGPRRSTALSTFTPRAGEGTYETRRRMHDIIRAVSDNSVLLPGGKKLFATYAKSKPERDIASHAAWVKRAVAAIAPSEVQRLDMEYSTGGVWIGPSFVGSAKQPLPPGVAAADVLWDETKGGKHWIHVDGLARELGVSFPLYSWNAGGVAENNYARAISDLVERIPVDALILVQEVARQEAGWQRTTLEQWQSLQHREADAWRDTGLIYRPTQWRVMRRKVTPRGTWFRLRHITGTELWVGTAHFTPGTSQIVHAEQVSAHLQGLPPTQLPVLLGCDVNSVMSWASDEQGEGVPAAKNGKTFEFLSQCRSRGLTAIAPPAQDFETPTSCPRQDRRAGKQIDAILGARVRTGPLLIHQGSHKALGTDHELLEVRAAITEGHKGRPYQTSPKIWIGGITSVPQVLDQPALTALAAKCTRTKPGTAYKDPPEVQDAFHRARDTGVGADWTAARKQRKQVRASWERERLERATSGDWAAYRQLRKTNNEGWDMVFAEAHEGKDPHQVIHDHLAGIYSTGQVVPPLGPWEGDLQEFTMEELEQAVALGKKGKAIGVDGTSQEFLAGLVQVPGGKEERRSAPGKIDLHKAYDMVDRPALLTRLKASLGSIESPALFSYLAEQILEETRAEFEWTKRGQAFQGLELEEVLFMDDGVVWADSAKALGRKLEEWSQVLLRAGLSLNPAKCKVYLSPYATGPKEVRVAGTVIPQVPTLAIMGVPFRVGASSAELLAPFLQRTKDKFWALKHLLRASTPLQGRVQLLDRVVGVGLPVGYNDGGPLQATGLEQGTGNFQVQLFIPYSGMVDS